MKTNGPFVEIYKNRWVHFEDIRGVDQKAAGQHTTLHIVCGNQEAGVPTDAEIDEVLRVLDTLYRRYYLDST